MAKKFLATFPRPELMDEETVRAYATEFLSNPDAKKKIAIIVDEIGVIGGVVNRYIWGTHNIAYDVMWWVEPSERGKAAGLELFHAFEYWAKSVGCKQIVMVGIEDRTCKFYEKNGYTLQERGYVKDII